MQVTCAKCGMPANITPSWSRNGTTLIWDIDRGLLLQICQVAKAEMAANGGLGPEFLCPELKEAGAEAVNGAIR